MRRALYKSKKIHHTMHIMKHKLKTAKSIPRGQAWQKVNFGQVNKTTNALPLTPSWKKVDFGSPM